MIAGFLRSVNDQMPEEEMPQLYPFAARIVGTRGPWKERCGRVRACAGWAHDLGARRRTLATWLGHRWGLGGAEVGSLCGRAAMRRGGHNLALVLLEGLGRRDRMNDATGVSGAPMPSRSALTSEGRAPMACRR